MACRRFACQLHEEFGATDENALIQMKGAADLRVKPSGAWLNFNGVIVARLSRDANRGAAVFTSRSAGSDIKSLAQS